MDIDFVGPSMRGQFLDLIERFERTHGYEPIRKDPLGMEAILRKPIIKEGAFQGYIEIDACTYESNAATFHEDPSRRFPYSLCDDPILHQKVTLNEKREVFIPKKPLLFLFKLKALRDRTHDLKTKGAVLGVARRAWLQSKAVKDGSDLIALLDPRPQKYILRQEFDYTLLKQLIQKQNLYFVLESIKELPNKRESLERYLSTDRRKAEEWVKELFDNL